MFDKEARENELKRYHLLILRILGVSRFKVPLKKIVFVAILGCVLFYMTEHKACEFEILVFVLIENFESNVTYLTNIPTE